MAAEAVPLGVLALIRRSNCQDGTAKMDTGSPDASCASCPILRQSAPCATRGQTSWRSLLGRQRNIPSADFLRRCARLTAQGTPELHRPQAAAMLMEINQGLRLMTSSPSDTGYVQSMMSLPAKHELSLSARAAWRLDCGLIAATSQVLISTILSVSLEVH